MSFGSTLPPRHALLALLSVFIWGTNFVVIKVALTAIPPLTLAALRFALASLPLLAFVPRPKTQWRWLISSGILVGAGQFGLLYYALGSDIAPGLASLVIQTQVFFTISLAGFLMKERVKPFQIAGLVIASIGIATIASHIDATTTARGLVLVICAAACWALGNMAIKMAGTRDMFAFTIWSSAFAVPPLLVLCFVLEGAPAIQSGLMKADGVVWAAVLWQAVGNTIVGYGLWNWLLTRYPAAAVTPMALLVPVFGMSSSWLVLGEPMQAWKLIAAGLVMIGIATAVMGASLLASLKRR